MVDFTERVRNIFNNDDINLEREARFFPEIPLDEITDEDYIDKDYTTRNDLIYGPLSQYIYAHPSSDVLGPHDEGNYVQIEERRANAQRAMPDLVYGLYTKDPEFIDKNVPQHIKLAFRQEVHKYAHQYEVTKADLSKANDNGDMVYDGLRTERMAIDTLGSMILPDTDYARDVLRLMVPEDERYVDGDDNWFIDGYEAVYGEPFDLDQSFREYAMDKYTDVDDRIGAYSKNDRVFSAMMDYYENGYVEETQRKLNEYSKLDEIPKIGTFFHDEKSYNDYYFDKDFMTGRQGEPLRADAQTKFTYERVFDQMLRAEKVLNKDAGVPEIMAIDETLTQSGLYRELDPDGYHVSSIMDVLDDKEIEYLYGDVDHELNDYIGSMDPIESIRYTHDGPNRTEYQTREAFDYLEGLSEREPYESDPRYAPPMEQEDIDYYASAEYDKAEKDSVVSSRHMIVSEFHDRLKQQLKSRHYTEGFLEMSDQYGELFEKNLNNWDLERRDLINDEDLYIDFMSKQTTDLMNEFFGEDEYTDEVNAQIPKNIQKYVGGRRSNTDFKQRNDFLDAVEYRYDRKIDEFRHEHHVESANHVSDDPFTDDDFLINESDFEDDGPDF